ncbi:MAG TPA: cupin domain-containing protein [Gaiellaceae bacterium]|nr:cupin domain-containing protein [Gaiellaceae bacterium]
MRHWNVTEITEADGSRSPHVLHSQEGEARVVAIHLRAGQELGDHQVKEAALLLVADGRVRVEAGGESVDAGVGTVVRFDPDERHAVVAEGDARVVLVLAPWPAEGHYRPGELRGAGLSASSPDAA